MLIPYPELCRKYGIDDVTGVLHVGSHIGEECDWYVSSGVTRVVWIEANPDLIPVLAANVAHHGHEIIQALVLDKVGETVTFNVTNNLQSSSVLPMKTHLIVSPDVHYVATQQHVSTTLDELAKTHDFSGLTFLNADVQGVEGLVLAGAEGLLAQFDHLYLEVNRDELYESCSRLPALTKWLFRRGFDLIEVQMAGNAGWGDGYWRKAR